VEEQYYLFWPLVLFALVKLKQSRERILFFTLALIAISTAGGQWLLQKPGFAELAYYSLPTRMGELSVGGLLALLAQGSGQSTEQGFWAFPRSLSQWQRNALSVLGLLGLLGTFCAFSSATPFPGLASLLPCGAAFCLIAAGPGAVINRSLLSWKPLVFIGSLSYSLYLWHFPILAFLRYSGELNNWTALPAVILTFALAFWSKFKIEDRFRHTETSFVKAFWRFYAVPGLAVLLLVIVAYDSGGLKQRYFFSKSDIEEDTNFYYKNYCHDQVLADCRIGDKRFTARTLLIGDSHANHFMPFWEKLGQDKGFSIEARSNNSCSPIFSDMVGDDSQCLQQKKWFREHYSDFKKVILIARWEYLFTDVKHLQRAPELLKAFASTIATLRSHHIEVIVMPQVPTIADSGYSRACRQKYFLLGLFVHQKERETPIHFSATADLVNLQLKDFLISFPKTVFFDPVAACPEVRRRWPYRENGMAYKDENHLTMKGSQNLADCYFETGLPIPVQ